MAIVVDNSILKGLSGRLGGALVFKKYGGKTVVAQRSAPAQTQSEQQKANRNKFKEATSFAKAAMADPVRKEYYWKKAKKLKLPNANSRFKSSRFKIGVAVKLKPWMTPIQNIFPLLYIMQLSRIKLDKVRIFYLYNHQTQVYRQTWLDRIPQ